CPFVGFNSTGATGLPAHGVVLGVKVGVALTSGVGVRVCVAVRVEVRVGVALGCGVGVRIGVGVRVGVGVGVKVGGFGSYSNAPISHLPLIGRTKARWSWVNPPPKSSVQPAGAPASMAGLPDSNACV